MMGGCAPTSPVVFCFLFCFLCFFFFFFFFWGGGGGCVCRAIQSLVGQAVPIVSNSNMVATA